MGRNGKERCYSIIFFMVFEESGYDKGQWELPFLNPKYASSFVCDSGKRLRFKCVGDLSYPSGIFFFFSCFFHLQLFVLAGR